MSDRFQFPRRYAKRETVKRPFEIVKTWSTPSVGDSNAGSSDADSTIQHEVQRSSSPDVEDLEFTAASGPAETPVDPPLAEAAEIQERQQIEAEPGQSVEEVEPPVIQESLPGSTQVENHQDVPPEETEPQTEPLQVCTGERQDSDHDFEMPCIQDALILELEVNDVAGEESGPGEATSPKSCTEPGLKDVEPDDLWTVKNWTDVGNPETLEQGSEDLSTSEQVVEPKSPHAISDLYREVPVSEQIKDITASSSEETADPASTSVNISDREKPESLSSEIGPENKATELSPRNGKSTPMHGSPTKQFSILLDRIEVEKYLSTSSGKGSRESRTNRGSASQEKSQSSIKSTQYKEGNTSTLEDEDSIVSSTHVDKIPKEKTHLQSKASEKKSASKKRPKLTAVLPEDDVPGSEDTMDSETSFQSVDDVTPQHKNVEKEHAEVSDLSPLMKSASVRNKKYQERTKRDSSSLESNTSNRDASPVTKKRPAVDVSKPKSAKQRKKSPKSESEPEASISYNQRKPRRSARTLSPEVELSTSDSGSGKVKPHSKTLHRKTSPKMPKPQEDSSSEVSQESEMDESYGRANSSKSRFTESMPVLEKATSNRGSHRHVTKDAKLDKEDNNVKSRGRKTYSRSKSLSPSADLPDEMEEEDSVISTSRGKNNRSQSLSPAFEDVEVEDKVKSKVKQKVDKSKSLSPSDDLEVGVEEDSEKTTGRERYQRSVCRSPAGQEEEEEEEEEEEKEQQKMKSTDIDVRTLPCVPVATSGGEGGEATNDSDFDASSVNTSLQLEVEDTEVTPRGSRHSSALTGSLWKGKKISAVTKQGMTSRKLKQTTRAREEDTPGFVSTSPSPAKKKSQTKAQSERQRKPSSSQVSHKSRPVKRKKAARRQNVDDDDDEEDERPRGRSVAVWSTYDQPRKGKDIMDLDIVLECLRTTERDMLADSDSRTCDKATQKVAAFVRKEVHKSISLVQEIKQRQTRCKKARTRVKNMRVDLQEKQKDKFKLTSKLRKLQAASGIDEDLININSWLDDSEKLMRAWDKSKAGQTKPQKYKWIGELSEEMKSLC